VVSRRFSPKLFVNTDPAASVAGLLVDRQLIITNSCLIKILFFFDLAGINLY
jgi:hypothetical protein